MLNSLEKPALAFFVVLFLLVSAQPILPAVAQGSDNDAIYLQLNEVGKDFKMTEKYSSLNENPPAFAYYGGKHSGLKVFLAPRSASLQRVVDIRWVFPDSKSAQAFLIASAKRLAEYFPPVPTAPSVGDLSMLVGGDDSLHKALTGKGGFYTYAYLFASGRVAGKVFAAQGADAEKPLTPEMLLPLARKAAERCKSY